MCQFLSALVLKNGDVLHHPMLDSHSDLVALFKLPDGHAHHQHFAKIELTPPAEWKGWEDVSTWNFRLDEETKPGWWDDIAANAEARVRAIIQRAILPQGEHAFWLDGLLIIGPGVTVRTIHGGRVFCCGGTLSNFRGGTLSNFWGGTLSNFWGGTLSNFRGGTLSDFWGGTLSNFRGGTLSNFWGGTLSNFWGGTLSNFRGGTLSNFWGGTLSNFWGGTLSDFWGGTIDRASAKWVTPRIFSVAKGVKLNKAARQFVVQKAKAKSRTPTTKTAKRKAVAHG